MKIPQQITCQYSSENCSAVATNEDHFVQVLDLQAIVQRIAKPVRPVEQRQEAQSKKVDPSERRTEEPVQIFVTGSGNPSQRKRQAEKEQVHWYGERGE